MGRFAPLVAGGYMQGVQIKEVMPLEAPWKGGQAEKAGHLWKELWKRVVQESQVGGLDDAQIATSITTQTRTAFPDPTATAQSNVGPGSSRPEISCAEP